jgi:hypothetical protein
VGCLNLLELDNELSFASRIPVWMVLQRKRSESLAHFVLACVRGHLKVGVIVSSGVGFDHGGGGSSDGDGDGDGDSNSDGASLVEETGREV